MRHPKSHKWYPPVRILPLMLGVPGFDITGVPLAAVKLLASCVPCQARVVIIFAPGKLSRNASASSPTMYTPDKRLIEQPAVEVAVGAMFHVRPVFNNGVVGVAAQYPGSNGFKMLFVKVSAADF